MLSQHHHQYRHGKSFNSLSRDHLPVRDWDSRPKTYHFQLPLSGSLSRSSSGTVRSAVFRVFQLPLSGSLVTLSSSSSFAARNTFNSLSRDHVQHDLLFLLVAADLLSTPSLGITNCSVARRGLLERKNAFNSLSRDHAAPFR